MDISTEVLKRKVPLFLLTFQTTIPEEYISEPAFLVINYSLLVPSAERGAENTCKTEDLWIGASTEIECVHAAIYVVKPRDTTAMMFLNTTACGWLNVPIAIQCGLHTCILNASFGRLDIVATELVLLKKRCFNHENPLLMTMERSLMR